MCVFHTHVGLKIINFFFLYFLSASEKELAFYFRTCPCIISFERARESNFSQRRLRKHTPAYCVLMGLTFFGWKNNALQIVGCASIDYRAFSGLTKWIKAFVREVAGMMVKLLD